VPSKVNISKHLNNVLEILNYQAINKHIIFNINIEGDELPILADKNLIETVLRNLISNAIKYSHKKSSIDIILRFNTTNLELSIKDYGIGICDERKVNLFSTSYQSGSLNTRGQQGTNGEQGTGLGLILCHDFITMHGGTIDVASEESKGSTFTITIPIAN
jgi:two-component system sensor histidine kinase/response regulator